MTTVPGFDAAVFPYTTDIPFLRAWGQPLLFGPGSIHVAHTSDEFIDIGEQQERAVDDYASARPRAPRTGRRMMSAARSRRPAQRMVRVGRSMR